MNKKILRSFIKHYGVINQMQKAAEECSELIKAIMKFICKGSYHSAKSEDYIQSVDAIIDEIADVEIMTAQLKIMFGCENAVNERIQYKIDRQQERMINNE